MASPAIGVRQVFRDESTWARETLLAYAHVHGLHDDAGAVEVTRLRELVVQHRGTGRRGVAEAEGMTAVVFVDGDAAEEVGPDQETRVVAHPLTSAAGRVLQRDPTVFDVLLLRAHPATLRALVDEGLRRTDGVALQHAVDGARGGVRLHQWLLALLDADGGAAHLRDVLTRGTARLCGRQFKSREMTVRCLECAVDDTCVMCVECFRASPCRNHSHRMAQSGGGMCDCGDPTAWKSTSFCSRHAGVVAEEDPCDSIPAVDHDWLAPVLRGVAQLHVQLAQFLTLPPLYTVLLARLNAAPAACGAITILMSTASRTVVSDAMMECLKTLVAFADMSESGKRLVVVSLLSALVAPIPTLTSREAAKCTSIAVACGLQAPQSGRRPPRQGDTNPHDADDAVAVGDGEEEEGAEAAGRGEVDDEEGGEEESWEDMTSDDGDGEVDEAAAPPDGDDGNDTDRDEAVAVAVREAEEVEEGEHRRAAVAAASCDTDGRSVPWRHQRTVLRMADGAAKRCGTWTSSPDAAEAEEWPSCLEELLLCTLRSFDGTVPRWGGQVARLVGLCCSDPVFKAPHCRVLVLYNERILQKKAESRGAVSTFVQVATVPGVVHQLMHPPAWPRRIAPTTIAHRLMTALVLAASGFDPEATSFPFVTGGVTLNGAPHHDAPRWAHGRGCPCGELMKLPGNESFRLPTQLLWLRYVVNSSTAAQSALVSARLLLRSALLVMQAVELSGIMCRAELSDSHASSAMSAERYLSRFARCLVVGVMTNVRYLRDRARSPGSHSFLETPLEPLIAAITAFGPPFDPELVLTAPSTRPVWLFGRPEAIVRRLEPESGEATPDAHAQPLGRCDLGATQPPSTPLLLRHASASDGGSALGELVGPREYLLAVLAEVAWRMAEVMDAQRHVYAGSSTVVLQARSPGDDDVDTNLYRYDLLREGFHQAYLPESFLKTWGCGAPEQLHGTTFYKPLFRFFAQLGKQVLMQLFRRTGPLAMLALGPEEDCRLGNGRASPSLLREFLVRAVTDGLELAEARRRRLAPATATPIRAPHVLAVVHDWLDALVMPLVLLSQVEQGLWRRNPGLVKQHSHAYNCLSTSYCIENDIFTLQLLAAVLPPQDFAVHVLQRFSYLPQVEKHTVRGMGYARFLRTMLTIALESGKATRVKEMSVVSLERRAIHHLALTPMVFSQLRTLLTTTSLSSIMESVVIDDDDDDDDDVDDDMGTESDRGDGSDDDGDAGARDRAKSRRQSRDEMLQEALARVAKSQRGQRGNLFAVKDIHTWQRLVNWYHPLFNDTLSSSLLESYQMLARRENVRLREAARAASARPPLEVMETLPSPVPHPLHAAVQPFARALLHTDAVISVAVYCIHAYVGQVAGTSAAETRKRGDPTTGSPPWATVPLSLLNHAINALYVCMKDCEEMTSAYRIACGVASDGGGCSGSRTVVDWDVVAASNARAGLHHYSFTVESVEAVLPVVQVARSASTVGQAAAVAACTGGGSDTVDEDALPWPAVPPLVPRLPLDSGVPSLPGQLAPAATLRCKLLAPVPPPSSSSISPLMAGAAAPMTTFAALEQLLTVFVEPGPRNNEWRGKAAIRDPYGLGEKITYLLVAGGVRATADVDAADPDAEGEAAEQQRQLVEKRRKMKERQQQLLSKMRAKRPEPASPAMGADVPVDGEAVDGTGDATGRETASLSVQAKLLMMETEMECCICHGGPGTADDIPDVADRVGPRGAGGVITHAAMRIATTLQSVASHLRGQPLAEPVDNPLVLLASTATSDVLHRLGIHPERPLHAHFHVCGHVAHRRCVEHYIQRFSHQPSARIFDGRDFLRNGNFMCPLCRAVCNTFSPVPSIKLTSAGGAPGTASAAAAREVVPAVDHSLVSQPGLLTLLDGRTFLREPTSRSSLFEDMRQRVLGAVPERKSVERLHHLLRLANVGCSSSTGSSALYPLPELERVVGAEVLETLEMLRVVHNQLRLMVEGVKVGVDLKPRDLHGLLSLLISIDPARVRAALPHLGVLDDGSEVVFLVDDESVDERQRRYQEAQRRVLAHILLHPLDAARIIEVFARRVVEPLVARATRAPPSSPSVFDALPWIASCAAPPGLATPRPAYHVDDVVTMYWEQLAWLGLLKLVVCNVTLPQPDVALRRADGNLKGLDEQIIQSLKPFQSASLATAVSRVEAAGVLRAFVCSGAEPTLAQQVLQRLPRQQHVDVAATAMQEPLAEDFLLALCAFGLVDEASPSASVASRLGACEWYSSLSASLARGDPTVPQYVDPSEWSRALYTSLLHLPRDYLDVISNQTTQVFVPEETDGESEVAARRGVCAACGQRMKEPVYCCGCGQYFCLRNAKEPELCTHSRMCSGGTAIFIVVKMTALLLIDAIDNRAEQLRPVYLDRNGEPDVNLGRGLQLTLSHEHAVELVRNWMHAAWWIKSDLLQVAWSNQVGTL